MATMSEVLNMKNIKATKISILRNCLSADMIDMIAEYLESAESLTFLFVMGRFIKKFYIDAERLKDIGLYMHKPKKAPIVKAMIYRTNIYKVYAFMYNIMSSVISENIVITGSWGLKIYQLKNFIFDKWIPNGYQSCEKLYNKYN